MIPEPVTLKTDGLGRVRTPLAQREALLDALERSGLSGMKFAALHGLNYPSLADWVQQRKRGRQKQGLQGRQWSLLCRRLFRSEEFGGGGFGGGTADLPGGAAWDGGGRAVCLGAREVPYPSNAAPSEGWCAA
jgi:hypothetical protein